MEEEAAEKVLNLYQQSCISRERTEENRAETVWLVHCQRYLPEAKMKRTPRSPRRCVTPVNLPIIIKDVHQPRDHPT
jgi:hypothetical protein